MSDSSAHLEGARARVTIDKETKEWRSNQDVELPIRGSDIPNFKAWIDWNGFQVNRETGKGHNGYDFAAYLNTDNQIILGLPPQTPIRAIADGVVSQAVEASELTNGGYGAEVNIQHGAEDSKMFSSYLHIVPEIKRGVVVKKGDIIGKLFKEAYGKPQALVHLHLMLGTGDGLAGVKLDDPGLIIDNRIYKYKVEPQGSYGFSVSSLPNVEIYKANFFNPKVSS